MQLTEWEKNQSSQTIAIASEDFEYFIFNVFSKSFDNFIGGGYIKELAGYYGDNIWTSRMSGRDHFKSAGLYAYFMWILMKQALSGGEYQYFSFQEAMSKYHIGKIKDLIQRNPYYEACIDRKPRAEGVIDYFWGYDENRKPLPSITLEPHGLLAFKRGIHCPGIFIDDPLRDPENKLNPTIIEKVNRIIFTELLDMVNKGGFCHIVGTPQTWQDFFFNEKMKLKFAVRIQPSIISDADKIAIWPEWHNWEELNHRREMRGVKIFNQEYMCRPVYAENSYFEEKQILNLINSELTNLQIREYKQEFPEDKPIIDELNVVDVYAGLDIGKKAHPSHFAVFKNTGSMDEPHFVEIHQKFMDGWDYIKQKEYCDRAIEFFKINTLRYDNTRGEFESFAEQGLLGPEYEPVNFSEKTKNGMAANLQKYVINSKIELIDDSRQFNQIVAVDNDLQTMASPEGHGDSFWSICLAIPEIIMQVRAWENKPEGW